MIHDNRVSFPFLEIWCRVAPGFADALEPFSAPLLAEGDPGRD